MIENVLETQQPDSPLYTCISRITPPQFPADEINCIMKALKDNEESIYALTEKAKLAMSANKFDEAEKMWAKLGKKVENEKYYIQQQALCRYKSGTPSKLRALTDALGIMEKIENQTDTETLGILGAINKRLWEETKDQSYLNSAIESYRKGWNLYKDYYTGENYANCMYMKSNVLEGNLKIHSKTEAEIVFHEVIQIVKESLKEIEPEELKWKYATLANAYYALKQNDDAQKYEDMFRKQSPVSWEIETFEKTKNMYVEAD